MKSTHSCIQAETHEQLQPFMAIQLNHIKRLYFYLKNGLDANLRDLQRQTLLVRACEVEHQKTALKFVNLLLKYKARIEERDMRGMNALHKAVCSGHEQVVSRLLEFAGDFNINATDVDGNTALMYAVIRKNYEIAEQLIKVLRKYDLSVDISNNEDKTPLMQAAILKQDEIAECLVTLGKASEQARDKHLRKSATEWKRTKGADKDRSAYPPILRGSHIYPPLTVNSCQKNQTKERPNPSPSPQGTYRWPDLKWAYTLYEGELASSYRKSAPPRIKTPPPTSDTSSERTWRKTASAMRQLKQRRHTIALSESLPGNLNSRFALARRSIPSSFDRRRSLSIVPPDLSWQPRFIKENSFRGKSDSQVPSTAPAEMDSTSFQKNKRNRIRHSVSFQFLKINDEPDSIQSPGRTRRSSLKLGENTGFRNASNVERTLFEHEEESVENYEDN